MTNKKTLATLQTAAEKQGMFVRAYSPGDGSTRYRFYRFSEVEPAGQDWFGPSGNYVYSAVGLLDAKRFLGKNSSKGRR